MAAVAQVPAPIVRSMIAQALVMWMSSSMSLPDISW